VSTGPRAPLAVVTRGDARHAAVSRPR